MESNSGTEQSLRKYYDRVPYPANPIDETLSENADVLYIHNFLTPYYLRNRALPPTRPLRLLDAGCGSGFKTLALAQANPDARIVGIDLSDMSLQIARQRLVRHGYGQTEFFALPVERVGELGETFDYINCDEVLYLLPDPEAALRALKAVLAPGGILRTNLHNRYQREPLYRAQRAFRLMNTAGDLQEEAQADLVRQVMNNLKDSVYLKHVCWNGQSDQKERSEWIEMNYLLEGDKGFTVPEMFELLERTELEFIGMVQWPQWELLDLFQDPESVPSEFASASTGHCPYRSGCTCTN